MRKVALLSGGAGFVCSHVVEKVLRDTDWDVVVVDRLDTSGNLNRLSELSAWEEYKRRVRVYWHDLKAPIGEHLAKQIGTVDYVLHLAASSHVDRSIEDPLLFVYDNVVGTTNMLQFARTHMSAMGMFVNFSTDECFGPAHGTTRHGEWDRFNPGNPYAASKAGATSMTDAFANTYGLRAITTFTMNVFGPRQHPEKFVPMVIRSVLRGDTVPIHADPTCTRAGSRFYIHAGNVAHVILELLRRDVPKLNGSGKQGKYNIVGEREVDNLTLAQMIAGFVGKPLKYELVNWHSSRPGHDLRYGLDGSLLSSMGIGFESTFEQSLEQTVRWTLDNQRWL